MARKNPYKGADRFTLEAKKQGYPARSVFKLQEIDRRVTLLKPGMRVLDLGAAPGSWSLYAAERIGPTGKLLAIDLKPLEIPLPANATSMVEDGLSLENEALATYAPYDVVLSDMAPNTTGNRFGDQMRSLELWMAALRISKSLLRVGGAFVGKIFMGPDFQEARAALRKVFTKERLIRPEGTRSVSYEIFVIGIGRRP